MHIGLKGYQSPAAVAVSSEKEKRWEVERERKYKANKMKNTNKNRSLRVDKIRVPKSFIGKMFRNFFHSCIEGKIPIERYDSCRMANSETVQYSSINTHNRDFLGIIPIAVYRRQREEELITCDVESVSYCRVAPDPEYLLRSSDEIFIFL